MSFFEIYASNTTAGSGNQLYFAAPHPCTGRLFYRVTVGGEYDYALLFSNLMDSTYSDGSVSHKNLVCEGWTLQAARIARCKTLNWRGEETCPDVALEAQTPLTFDGKAQKHVAPGEFFASDPVCMRLEAGEYLMLEMTFSGPMIPYHEESLLPVFRKAGESWQYNRRMPFAGMVGCRRTVRHRVGFLGDSITQGIGTELNSYDHWNAHVAAMLGEDCACWNLGLGYGRANDAASDGAWLYKAKHNDVVVVCYGVNDILQNQPEEQIRRDLRAVVRCLKAANVKVVLQTVPPFDYQGAHIGIWQRINHFIRAELAQEADLLFDAAEVLKADDEQPQRARYGGHPDAAGCRAWAEALGPVLKEYLETLK